MQHNSIYVGQDIIVHLALRYFSVSHNYTYYKATISQAYLCYENAFKEIPGFVSLQETTERHTTENYISTYLS